MERGIDPRLVFSVPVPVPKCKRLIRSGPRSIKCREPITAGSDEFCAEHYDEWKLCRVAALTPKHLKLRANRCVTNAVRRGDLSPRPCERCGDKSVGVRVRRCGRVEVVRLVYAHHEDYARPQEVIFGCVAHAIDRDTWK
jgi:hypothetical protein